MAPTATMRRSHFELIKHQRDVTVHRVFARPTTALPAVSIVIVRKDAQGKQVPVNAPGEFCAGCHEYAGASLDCFTCHAAKPTGN